MTCLLGRNGVGKTTLLKVLMGLLPSKEGAVRWEGNAITGFKPHQRVHAGIAYVPQGREIFGRLTVEENLLMGLSRFPGAEAKEVPAFIYELFPVLLQMKQRRGGDLSGGQQRRRRGQLPVMDSQRLFAKQSEKKISDWKHQEHRPQKPQTAGWNIKQRGHLAGKQAEGRPAGRYETQPGCDTAKEHQPGDFRS